MEQKVGRWSTREYSIARQMRAMGYMYKEIAEQLGREENYIIKKFSYERNKK